MVKFRDIGAYKRAKNVPYCMTPVPLKNGMLVTADLAAKTTALPTVDTAKGDVYLVMNRIDKPETKEPNAYVIDAGEYPRLFRLKSLDGEILDMDMDQVTTAYTAIAVGDKLVGGTDGKLVKAENATGYDTFLEVIEKTAFCGEGLAVRVAAD